MYVNHSAISQAAKGCKTPAARRDGVDMSQGRVRR